MISIFDSGPKDDVAALEGVGCDLAVVDVALGVTGEVSDDYLFGPFAGMRPKACVHQSADPGPKRSIG